MENSRFFLTSTTSADKPKIIEFGNLVFHDGRRIAQLGAMVLVVSGANGDDGAVDDVPEGDHFERNWQGLVGPPVVRQ